MFQPRPLYVGHWISQCSGILIKLYVTEVGNHDRKKYPEEKKVQAKIQIENSGARQILIDAMSTFYIFFITGHQKHQQHV